jgi:hypothetical protein
VIEGLTTSARSADGPPRFRYLHLFGTHFPAAIDATCAEPAKGGLRVRAVSTTRCMMRQLSRLFRAMADTGLYDETAIVLVSDHRVPKVDLDAGAASPPSPRHEKARSAKRWASRWVCRCSWSSRPTRGPMQISDRSVSLCDVPATVLDMLGIVEDLGFACESVFAASHAAPRRHYRYPTYVQQNLRPRDRRYFFDFKAFEVNGHSWHPNSWVRSR